MNVKMTILALTTALFTNHAHAAADAFQGEYSQSTQVMAGDDGETLESTENTLSVAKVVNMKNTYFVNIATVGGRLHLCDFSEEMKIKNVKTLSFKSKTDKCSVDITKTKAGLQVSADQCESYCGYGISLEGTGEDFIKVHGGNAITRAQEAGYQAEDGDGK